MKLTTKILLSILLGSVVPLVILGAITFYQQKESVKELAFSYAKSHADLFANTITVEPPLSSAPLYRQADALQQYVEALHSDQGLDIVVISRDRRILADVVPQNIGERFTHDTANEIEQTMSDGVPRSFVEVSVDYPDGIQIIVVPLKAEKGHAVGAVLVESLPGQEGVFQTMAEGIATFIATPLPGKIPTVLENEAALDKLVGQFRQAESDNKHGTLIVVDAQGSVLSSTVSDKHARRIINSSNGVIDEALHDGEKRIFEAPRETLGHKNIQIVVPVHSGQRVIGAVILHYQGSDKETIEGTEKIAAYFANSIAFAPRQKVTSFFNSPAVLEEYVTDFHKRQGRNIVVVDQGKVILADAIRENIGSVFEHDRGGEILQTMGDGRPRTFVETSVDYPQGIQQAVVPVKDQSGATIGAVILEFSGDYQIALAAISKMGQLIGTVVVVLGVIMALVAGRIGLSITNPVKSLEASATRLAEGDLAHRAEIYSKDEIGQLAATFNDMADKLHAAQETLIRSERLAAIGQVTGTVSHELRNPLGTIRTSIYTIAERTRDKGLGVERALDRVERNIARCDAIIGDLLEFTRVRELTREPVAFDDWIGHALDEHALPDGITLERDLQSGAEVAIDGERLRRALVNLLDNACQAIAEDVTRTAGGGRVAVGSALVDGRVEIRVGDNGPGIPTDVLDKVFEPLYSTKSFGVGLGLPTVKQIVEQHGGKIDITSEEGRGTEVILSLPLEPGVKEKVQ